MPDPTFTPEDEAAGFREVLADYPPHVQQHLIKTLPPALRGWWTAQETAEHPDRKWIEVTPPGAPEPRFIPGWVP